MIPVLPVPQIRAAIAAEDWPQATSLLAAHQLAKTGALASVGVSTATREAWTQLQAAERGLIGELRQARDQAGAALADLARDQRGARAWLRELA